MWDGRIYIDICIKYILSIKVILRFKIFHLWLYLAKYLILRRDFILIDIFESPLFVYLQILANFLGTDMS